MAKPPKYAEQARVLRAVADNLKEAASAEAARGFVGTLQEVADTLDPPKDQPVPVTEPEPEPEAPVAEEVPVEDTGAQTEAAPDVVIEGGQTEAAPDVVSEGAQTEAGADTEAVGEESQPAPAEA